MAFLYILIATLSISLFSLVGVFTISKKSFSMDKILLSLVGLSTGTLLGGAFFHLLPEAAETLDSDSLYLIVVIAFVLFFFVEKIFHWRHCHDGVCDEHAFGYMNLIGDGIHNFIDGLIIAGAFMTSVPLGITTALALAFHEIPQEISDFGVLLYSGFSRKKAIILNFVVAATSILGGIVGYFLSSRFDTVLGFFLPFAAGGFIYVATSDLIPEIRDEMDKKRSFYAIALFIVGLIFMYAVKFLE